MKDQNIWVSIIIPTYNRKDVISRAIDSCLRQTYDNVEIVICDDHSSDGTLDFLKKKYADISNIKFCVTPEGKKGANAARNEGIRISRGEFIAFVDDDDELVEDSIEVRLNTALNTDSALVYGDIYYKRSDKEAPILVQYDDIAESEYDQRTYLLRELALCVQVTIMVKKSALESVGYLDENMISRQDDDVVVSVGLKYKLQHCKQVVAILGFSEKSIVSNKKNVYLGFKIIINKYKDEIRKYASYRRYLLWQIRMIAIWAQYREQYSKLRVMKTAYRMLYRFVYNLIGRKKYFRRW